MITYQVTIITHHSKNKKYANDVFEFEDIPSVARCLLTFQPKRGYQMISFDVEVGEKLV